MFHLDDIISLTDFQRNTRAHIKRLKKSGRPLVLTINGKAAVVLNDAADYQASQQQLQARELIESLERGSDAARSGKGKPFDQVMARIRDRYIDDQGRARAHRRKAS